MLLGLLTALSYSDLVKSWRGECGGGGIVGNHVWVTVVVCTCMLSCTPLKVFAWALGDYICMTEGSSPLVCGMQWPKHIRPCCRAGVFNM